MQTARLLVSGDQKLRPKFGRRPLQPKNSPANPAIGSPLSKPKHERIEISLVLPDDRANKENRPTYSKIESLDGSLAEELSAIRKKLERLRLDKERTEKMLKERDMVLERKAKELEERGEIQILLEIEVDRLYRLNQLQTQSMLVSPMRSLREKEQVKKINAEESPKQKSEDRGEESESVGDNTMQSPEFSFVGSSETDK
ncbi:hypothetical protein F2P56_008221 [Juglans regia]|uniref:High mobility group B protein 6 n=2 Tax=Juglans regia TaxID=51240 RepID=A0A2I4EIU9_JUGRE|nr:high mobility group B protein 6 [Juglans regia]KAF5471429.1 hypothetical protein F2P56_008221 [Juglans regia]